MSDLPSEASNSSALDVPVAFTAIFVEDDKVLLDLTTQYCRSHGIAIIGASDGQALDRALANGGIDMVMLDIGLPGEDGLSICRRLRAASAGLPIIVVSGRGEDIDRVLGLELGADDYITKPFVPRELVARMKALHRRATSAPPDPVGQSDESDVRRFAPYVFDIKRRELRSGDRPIVLTNAEIDLLTVLCRHPGETLSRTDIMSAMESVGASSSERGIDVTVARLRNVIEHDPKTPRYIKTVWGSGYLFTP